MDRALDFIVFGVPRSGTKGLARGLSLHADVYCALERFTHERDHSGLLFPKSFLETGDLKSRHDLDKARKLQADLAGKGEIRHAGNKYPRYYFALDRINREVPRLKNIWIYRSPFGFMQSWNRKEANHRTLNWSSGQVGLFGVLELLSCIESCARLDKDVFIFPYEQGLNQSAAPVLTALDFLGADGRLFDRQKYEAEHLPKARQRARRSPAPHEQEFLDALRIRDLDQMIGERCGVLSHRARGELADYLDSIGERLPGAVDQAFRACRDPAVAAFGAHYFYRHRQGLTHLVRRMHGSQIIAGFQRFGLHERLKHLYTQRWVIKRHLASMALRRIS